jgi:hypothetical protein
LNIRLQWERTRLTATALFSRHPESNIDGVDLVDLRADRNFDHDQIKRVLNEALGHIRAAQGGFPELVNDHLRRVVAVDSSLESASPLAQAFYTDFRAADRRNTFYLACRLVWAATFIRLMRNHRWWRRGRYRHRARAAAQETQLRFVRQFPDAERWENYLGLHGE